MKIKYFSLLLCTSSILFGMQPQPKRTNKKTFNNQHPEFFKELRSEKRKRINADNYLQNQIQQLQQRQHQFIVTQQSQQNQIQQLKLQILGLQRLLGGNVINQTPIPQEPSFYQTHSPASTNSHSNSLPRSPSYICPQPQYAHPSFESRQQTR